MADNFNLTGFLKKNQLLNENIGGYVDLKPVKEEMGTAMENETDVSWMDMDNEQKFLDAGGKDLIRIAQSLVDAGYDVKEVIDAIKQEVYPRKIYR